MADSGWGCKSNGANPRWGYKSNFDGAVSPMGRCVHTNWGAQYRGAVSPASPAPTDIMTPGTSVHLDHCGCVTVRGQCHHGLTSGCTSS